MKKYFIEATGTAFLVFIGCGCALSSFEAIGVFGVGLSFGLVYALWYLMFNAISGSHLNPAISFSQYLIKKISVKQFWLYSLSQIIGGLIAALMLLFTYLLCVDGAGILASNRMLCGYGIFSQTSVSFFMAMLIEIFATLIFVLIFLITQHKQENKIFASLLLGVAYVLIVVFTFSATGACINPARAFGPAFVHFILGAPDCIVQFVWISFATLVGSFLGVLVFRKIYSKDNIEFAWKLKKNKSKKNNKTENKGENNGNC